MTSFTEPRCKQHNLMRCTLCPSEFPAVPVKPAVEVRPAEPAHQMAQQPVPAAAVTAVAEVPAMGPKSESKASIPDWIQYRLDRNDPDLIVTRSVDGSIERIQIKVCSICRNSLKVCTSYSVCVTPSEGKTTVWDRERRTYERKRRSYRACGECKESMGRKSNSRCNQTRHPEHGQYSHARCFRL